MHDAAIHRLLNEVHGCKFRLRGYSGSPLLSALAMTNWRGARDDKMETIEPPANRSASKGPGPDD